MRKLAIFTILFFSFIFTATAQISMERFLAPDYRILINANQSELVDQICQQLAQHSKDIYGVNRTLCEGIDQDIEPRDKEYQNHEYLLTIKEKESGDLAIVVYKIHRDSLDFEKIQWTVLAQNIEKGIDKVFSSIVQYDLGKNKFKTVLARKLLQSDQDIQATSDPTVFVIQEGNTKRYVSRDVAIERYQEKSPTNKSYKRASIELGVLLGIGATGYALSHNAMKEDWDFKNDSVDDYMNRFFTDDQMKYDDNTVGMNWGHAYAGVLYYSTARNNGLNSMESFLASLAGSTIWEYLIEWKEVVSINDQILTSTGGIVIGEALYQISNMLKGKGGLTSKVMSTIINPMGTINNASNTPFLPR